jgi:polynucleotide 5'-hydroxyl-kinase GRC3/NOL9
MTNHYQTNHDWERVDRHVVQPQQIVLVIGATDVGKSTFCRFLVERGVASGLKVAFVDADVGQSHIGPPTTIGMKCFTHTFTSGDESLASENESIFWDQGTNASLLPEPDDLYFVGWTSPEHHLLQCVTGTRLMVDAALKAGANYIVIDTTGYVEGSTAIVLKQHKIELVKPTHVICIHRSRELDSIVAPFESVNTIQVHRLAPHKSVTSRSSEFRRKYRESSFDCYFADAVQEAVPLHQIRGQRTPFFTGRGANTKELEILSNFVEDRVLYAEWGHRSLALVTLDALSSLTRARLKNHLSLTNLVTETPEYFERRLIGLLSASGKTLSIGIIEALDFRAHVLQMRCNAGTASETKIIQFGRHKADWTEK